MHKIRDPRDKRRWLILISQRNLLGRDRTAWRDHQGNISVYRSQDAPRCETWTHGLTDDNYKDMMD
jgi:hypothetical protein